MESVESYSEVTEQCFFCTMIQSGELYLALLKL